MPTRVGEECGLYIDLPYREGRPQPGDIIFTRGVRGVGSAYAVRRVREVRRRSRPGSQARWQMRVMRVPVEEASLAGRQWEMRWYPRRPKPKMLAMF